MVALTGRLRAKGVPFSRFGCMKGYGFHLLNVWNGREIGEKANRCDGCEKIEKTSWFCDLYYYMINFCNLIGLEQ